MVDPFALVAPDDVGVLICRLISCYFSDVLRACYIGVTEGRCRAAAPSDAYRNQRERYSGHQAAEPVLTQMDLQFFPHVSRFTGQPNIADITRTASVGCTQL